VRRLLDWLENRTGLESGIRTFLYEDIPASSGWYQVLGSVAIFSFLTQAFTGLLLAFNYAPTPGDAYNSLRYITSQVTAGRLIHGLHHWGASVMIIVVVLHMTQVFVWGAYKKPREATWMVGIVLLLVTLAYGLTGYLLPWDNRAYWGTMVTTRIAAQTPVFGPYLARLIGGGDGSIGVVTFARFFALHVMLLPPLTALLIGIHVYLVRKHGVTPAAGDTAPKKKFFPAQVFKDTVAIFIVFSILLIIAALVQVPLEHLADPTDASYTPRPEWYFLFLFQTLRLFEGPLEIFGSVVLPTAAVVALFLVPFIDRRPAVRLGRRVVAIAVVCLAGLGWTALTAAALRTAPSQAQLAQNDGSTVQAWQQLSSEELAGIGYFRDEKCASCHAIGHAAGGAAGPNLARISDSHRKADWMIRHFRHPSEMIPGTSMPPIQLSDDRLNTLAAFLLKLTPDNADALVSAREDAVRGAMVYQTNHCASCHSVNGSGANVGPPLNGLSNRREKDWIEKHFVDPEKMSPGSMMPSYRFNPKEMEQITAYLMQLPNASK
jgi:ubiquinol-cytochrome c reductase cytochrome b subunit